jgi:hypothetical protein
MVVKLTKCSAPDWEKTFATREEARTELLKYICSTCLRGDEWPDLPAEPPNPLDVNALLGTSCGLEYWVEESVTHVEPTNG